MWPRINQQSVFVNQLIRHPVNQSPGTRPLGLLSFSNLLVGHSTQSCQLHPRYVVEGLSWGERAVAWELMRGHIV